MKVAISSGRCDRGGSNRLVELHSEKARHI